MACSKYRILQTISQLKPTPGGSFVEVIAPVSSQRQNCGTMRHELSPEDAAFPLPNDHTVPGLTKIEYFAVVALQGYLAGENEGEPTPEDAARKAVDYAEALVSALKSRETNKK